MGTVAARNRAGPAAVVAAAFAAAVVVATLLLGLALPSDDRVVWWHPEIVVALTWTPVAAFLLRHRPRLTVGWIMLAAGVGAAAYVLVLNLAPWLDVRDLPGAGTAHWLSLWLWAIDTYLLTLVLPLVFPDGRLVSPLFRPVLAAACTAPLVVCVHLTLDPDVRRHDGGVWVYPYQDVPLPITVLLLGTLILGLVSVALRFARSAADVRRQIAWIVAPGVLAQAIVHIGESASIGSWPRNLTIAAVPICIAIAITRYRLYDIDFVVSRTLVYAGLAAMITGVYFALVAVATRIGDAHGAVAGLGGAIAAGALFEPVRRRLQRAVDRLVHGERDPYRITDLLNRRLQRISGTSDPKAALTVAAMTLREALHADAVVVEVADHDGETVSVRCGEPGVHRQTLPLVWHGETVGRVVLGIGRPLTARLAGVLARSLAELAGSTRLAIDVQRSRESILRTREEERRRLRRDLHDGLGPTLASLAMSVETARLTLRTDPEAADRLLRHLRSTIGGTVRDIRDLMEGLRPPALDDLGLAGALRALGGVVAGGDGPRVDVLVEGDLERLPAAAEVAAYRIVQEALTNVHRHARARTTVVTLRRGEDLLVTVCDDGVGIPPDARSGIGMSSMRERAAEVGGSCAIGPTENGAGTLLTARLPLNGHRAEPHRDTAHDP